MSLLQIRPTLISPRLLNPATLLFNRLSRGIMPRFSRLLIVYDNDEGNNSAPTNRQPQASKDVDTCKYNSFPPTGSTVAVQEKDRGPWTHETIVGNGTETTKEEATK